MKKLVILTAGLLLSVGVQAQKIVRPQPESGAIPTVHVQKPHEFELKNGLKVMVVEDHKLPRVSFTLTVDTPPIFEGEKVGVSSLTSAVVGNGTTKTPKDKFNEEIDFLGASVGFWGTGASASGLSRYSDKLLELLVEGAFHPLFDQDEFDKAKEQAIEGLKTKEKSATAIKGRVVNALVYGKNHPKGEFITEESLKGITLDDVKANYKKYFVPGNAYLVVIGDVNYKDIKSKITKLFGKWKKGTIKEEKFIEPKDVAKTEINFVDVPNAVQSEISLVNIVNLKPTDKDYFAALMADQILGGGGESRLFLNLREAHGWTYGAYSSLGSGKYTTKFTSSSSVRNAVTDSAVVEFMNELHKITTKPVEKSELDLAKAKFIGNFVMAIQKPGTIAALALKTKTDELPKDYYENYIKNIEAVTIEDVQKAAKKYFKPNNTRIVIVGKGSEVASKLEQLGYKVNYFDKYANPIEKPVFNKPIPAGVTVKTVLDNYIKAIGGREKLEAVKTLEQVTVGSSQGMSMTITTKVTSKKQFAMTLNIMGMDYMKQVITPTYGYMSMQGQKQELKAEELEQMQAATEGLFPELKQTAENTTLKAIETLEGKDVYVLVEGSTTSYYDVNTGLKLAYLQEGEVQGEKKQELTKLGDYKEVKGIKFPYLSTTSLGGQEVELKTTSIKINEGVTDADFK